MSKNKRGLVAGFFVGLLLFAGYPSLAFAQSSSNNYRVEESYFGVGGGVNSTSPNYQARQSLGSLGVGSASSNNYDAIVGFNTPSEPFLEMYVTGATVDFGVLEAETPAYGAARAEECNCSFSVRSYMTSEYVVVTASQPPQSEGGGHILNAKTTQGTPSTNSSTEEFGINLVDNTTPDIGADPANQPDNTFADGKAANGYSIPNQFKYSIGDIIARSPATAGNPGVGKTDYTISYMAKIGNITPAGNYVMQHDVIVVAVF